MDPAQLLKAESIFNDLVGSDGAARAATLDSRCAGDNELRSLVENMLAHDHSGMGGFLAQPVFLPTDDRLFGDEPRRPQSIGGYEIVRQIGEGGMGVVYEARQASPRRTVALKILRSALPSSGMLARFQHESHILAQLRHPGIAHIYEAAVTDIRLGDGIHVAQPYFAMELVEGLSLRDYAEARRLTIRQRLELIVLVCNAVQHAHEKGVIHRDLKPDNILVEDSGQPRILDFGVARLVGPTDEQQTLQTRAGEIIGTLAFMSPEQVGGDPASVDTRSDIYSLGVILYDLLTGKLPHDLAGLSLSEAARRIREVDPPPPSTHHPRLRGEPDWIVMKCLEKDRARRYSSVAALAEDIQRFLRDEAVVAGPPGRAYRLRKMVRRNRGAFAAGAAILATLIVAVIGTTYGLVNARRQRNIAESRRQEALHEQKTAQAVTRFLKNDLLGAIDPLRAPGDRDEKISDIVARAEKRVDSGALDGEPETEAAVRELIAHLLLPLGRFADAERHGRRAADIYKTFVPIPFDDLIGTLSNLGLAVQYQGRLPDAEAVYREAFEFVEQAGDRKIDPLVNLLTNYADLLCLEEKFDEAEPYYERVLAMPASDRPEQAGARGIALGNLGELYRQRGELDRALAKDDEALEVFHAAYGEDHQCIASTLNNKGLIYKTRGDRATAEEYYRQALDMRRRILPPDHVDLAQSLNNYAALLRDRGDYAEAEPIYRETLEAVRKCLPPGHFQIALVRRNLGVCLARMKRFAEAEPEILAAYDQLSTTEGLPPQHVQETMQILARLYEVWAEADPQSGAAPKAAEWRGKLAATSQPTTSP